MYSRVLDLVTVYSTRGQYPITGTTRGRAVQTDDSLEALNLDPWCRLELVRSQLACLLANVEQQGQYYFRFNLQEARA